MAQREPLDGALQRTSARAQLQYSVLSADSSASKHKQWRSGCEPSSADRICPMDGHFAYIDMENPTENPSKAAEYLKELNKIIETQQELLEKQKNRIEELEQQVCDLCQENACLKDQHQRHLATCRLQQQGNSHPTLGAIKENVIQEK